jgi:hypothetical protein
MSAPGNLRDGEIYLSDYLLDRLSQLGVKRTSLPPSLELFA